VWPPGPDTPFASAIDVVDRLVADKRIETECHLLADMVEEVAVKVSI
jgi:hypothetical protein